MTVRKEQYLKPIITGMMQTTSGKKIQNMNMNMIRMETKHSIPIIFMMAFPGFRILKMLEIMTAIVI